MPSRSIHVAANGKISFFYGWIIFHYMCVCMCIYIYNIMSQTVGHDWAAELIYIYIYIYKYINVHKHTHTYIMCVKALIHVQLFATPWTVAFQVPLSMGFSRQGYWSGSPFPSPVDLSNPGLEPRCPALHRDSLLSETTGNIYIHKVFFISHPLMDTKVKFPCLGYCK